MTTEQLNTKELFASIDKTTSELTELIFSADEKTINTVPFEDSWTTAQLASHVTKSNRAIVQGLNIKGRMAERNPDERVPELKATFLDFTIKFQSPDFILPAQNIYQKEKVIEDLKESIEQLKEMRNKVSLYEIINLPALGEITKLEMLHFVVYHTQRHIHQLKNIINYKSRLPDILI